MESSAPAAKTTRGGAALYVVTGHAPRQLIVTSPSSVYKTLNCCHRCRGRLFKSLISPTVRISRDVVMQPLAAAH
jgi:hypothetical protein